MKYFSFFYFILKERKTPIRSAPYLSSCCSSLLIYFHSATDGRLIISNEHINRPHAKMAGILILFCLHSNLPH